MEMPFFSVVITTFNRCDFLPIAIKSVIKQSFANWELVIIDDGSTDNTKNVVIPFLRDSRIKYYYQENQERSIARNNGVKKATGEYICFLDSDDYYLENHLSTFAKYIKQQNFPQKVIFFSNQTIKNGDQFFKKPYSYQPSPEKKDNLIFFGLFEAPANITTCIHHSFHNEVLFENTWLPFNEIYYFILQLLIKNYNLFSINEYTSVIVQHGNNTTSSEIEFIKSRYNYITHLSKVLKINNLLINIKRSEFILMQVYRSCRIHDKIRLLILSLRIYPPIITKRQFWGLVKTMIIR